MKYVGILMLLLACISCDGKSTVTERFKQVETQELILTDQHGKTYRVEVDEAGNLKAIPVKRED